MSATVDLAGWEDEIGGLALDLRSMPDAEGAFEAGVRIAAVGRALVDLAAAAGAGGEGAPIDDDAELTCVGGAEGVSVLGDELLLTARESGGQLRVDVLAGELRWHVDVGEPDSIDALSGGAGQIAGGLARDAKRALERKGRAVLAEHVGPAGAIVGQLASAGDHLSVSVQGKHGEAIEVIRRPGREPMSRADLEADEMQRFEEHLEEVAEQIDPDVDGLLAGDESALSGSGSGTVPVDVGGAVGSAGASGGAGASGIAAGAAAAVSVAAGAAVARRVAKKRAPAPAKAAAEPSTAAIEPAAAPVAAAPVAPVEAPPPWSCTHVVPSTGMASWTVPDGSLPSSASLAAGVQLQVVETRGAWARVRGWNGWEGWVDHRLLVPSGGDR